MDPERILDGSNNVDVFVIMNGGKSAAMQLERAIGELGDKARVYHYQPPRSRISTDEKLIARQKDLVLRLEETGSIESPFMKRGLGLIVDDVISGGRTLFAINRVLLAKGYTSEELFVFAQQYFAPEKGEEGLGGLSPYCVKNISFYKNLIDRWQNSLDNAKGGKGI